MKITLIIVLSALSIFVGKVALADQSVGCGLGSLIFKDKSIISALSRGTTNASFSSQLFGISSGTSGCSKHSIVQKEQAPRYFVEANWEQLRFEIAQGDGPYLTTLAALMGVNENGLAAFKERALIHYESLYKEPSVGIFMSEIKAIL